MRVGRVLTILFRQAAPAALAVTVLTAPACGASGEPPAENDVSVAASVSEPPIRPDRTPLVKGPVSADGLQVVLGTSDLGVGHNRIGFVLISPDGIVDMPTARVSARFGASEGREGVVKKTAVAVYQPWPYGSRGLYTMEMNLDAAGQWALDIAVDGPDGSTQTAQLFFDVAQSPSAPSNGSPALRSKSKTIRDVASVEELSTGSLHDPDVYQLSIAEAVTSGIPTVVVFASPAFCTNAVCGPQVEVLTQLKDKYQGEANFIHVDFYDNPQEIQGDLDAATISPTVLEWRLPSIEWTFVIDGDGVIAGRFEAFVTFDELEEELLRFL